MEELLAVTLCVRWVALVNAARLLEKAPPFIGCLLYTEPLTRMTRQREGLSKLAGLGGGLGGLDPSGWSLNWLTRTLLGFR